MKIYIAGKVTGLPHEEVAAKFAAAQQHLESLGYEVVNPIQVVNDPNCPWDLAMRKCLAAMLDCHAVHVLPCWKDSKGAKMEVEIAFRLQMPVYKRIQKDGWAELVVTSDLVWVELQTADRGLPTFG